MSRFVTIASLALLAGCSQEPAAPAPQPSEAAPAVAAIPVMGPERRILAIGDSLFAGYGLNAGESYPARLEAALRARGINAKIVNAGVSGDTAQAGAQRFAFVLDAQKPPPELVVIEFGGNDILRGLPPAQTRAAVEAMLAEAQRRKLPVLLMGMLAPPNLGPEYRAGFDPLYPALAKKYGARLVPFFLQATIGKPDLVQADHLHPTAQGVEEIVKATAGDVAGALPRR